MPVETRIDLRPCDPGSSRAEGAERHARPPHADRSVHRGDPFENHPLVQVRGAGADRGHARRRAGSRLLVGSALAVARRGDATRPKGRLSTRRSGAARATSTGATEPAVCSAVRAESLCARSVTPEERLRRATRDLAVRVGANVQPGQEVVLMCQVEHAPTARAVAREAYKAGASRVVDSSTPITHFRRAAIELGPEESLGYSAAAPARLGARLARVTAGADPAHRRCGAGALRATSTRRSSPSRSRATCGPLYLPLVAERMINWVIVSAPNAGWAPRCSASPTSSGCGTPSRPRRGSTRPTRWRRGARTTRGAEGAGRARSTSAASTRSGSVGRGRISPSA